MHRRLTLATLAALLVGNLVSFTQAEDKKEVAEALRFTMKTLDGKEKKLSDYQGKVVLVVNVASQCGLTPQYSELQKLYDKYKGKGFVVAGFPCNQFGAQEPGSAAEIRKFCTDEFGVTFDMFAKIDVNGEQSSPLYKYLTELKTEPKGAGKITWNFEKFLIGRDGKVLARFAPRTKPNDKQLTSMIESELSK